MSQGNGLVVMPQGGMVTRAGFGETSLEKRETSATAVAERAKAEVQARSIVALSHPRNVDGFRQRILEHTKRARFAEAARYSKPVGGKSIAGPSIRFVEAALQAYSNVVVDSEIIFDDSERQILRVSVADLETNVCYHEQITVTKRVERKSLRQGQVAVGSRFNSYGDVVHLVEATDDEFETKKGALVSKRVRTLGLRLLPPDIVEEAMSACLATLEKGDAADPAAARRKVCDAFHEIGVSPESLEKYLGHPLAETSPAELAKLRAVYAVIKDGEGTWHDALAAALEERGERAEEAKPAAATARGTEAVKARIAQQRQAAARQAEPPKDPAPQESDQPPPPATQQTPASTEPTNAAPAAGGGRGGRGKKAQATGQGDLIPQAQVLGSDTRIAPPPAATPRGPERQVSFAERREVEEIEAVLETIFVNRDRLPSVRARIQSLRDDVPAKAKLLAQLEMVESEIAQADRDADDVPDFGGTEG